MQIENGDWRSCLSWLHAKLGDRKVDSPLKTQHFTLITVHGTDIEHEHPGLRSTSVTPLFRKIPRVKGVGHSRLKMAAWT